MIRHYVIEHVLAVAGVRRQPVVAVYDCYAASTAVALQEALEGIRPVPTEAFLRIRLVGVA